MPDLGSILSKATWEKWIQPALLNRFIKGAFWSTTGSGASLFLQMLSMVLVANQLGSQDFGRLGIIQSTITTFAIFSGPSLGLTATKYLGEFRFAEKKRAGNVIGLTLSSATLTGLLIGTMVWLFSADLASFFFEDNELELVIKLSGITLFFVGINGAQTGIMMGLEDFKTLALLNLIRGCFSLIFLLVGTYFWGILGTVAALALVSFLMTVIYHLVLFQSFSKEYIEIDLVNSLKEWRLLQRFSLPALLSGLFVLPTMWLGNSLLVRESNGLQQMGLFNVANQWRQALLFLPNVISQPTVPILSDLYGRNLTKEFKKVLKLNLVVTLLVTVLPVLLILFMAESIMALYGPEFSGKGNVLIIVAISCVPTVVCGVLGTAIMSSGRMWLSLSMNLIWSVSFICFLLIGLPYGALGLGMAYTVSYVSLLVTLVTYYQVRYRFSIS